MKPIFEEERLFLNELLHIDLPTECWRASSKIYLDCTCKKPLYQFKVENNIAKITKNNTQFFIDYKQKKLDELQSIYNEEIVELVKKTQKFFYDYIFTKGHFNDDLFVFGHSSGKDSTVLLDQWIMFLQGLYESDIEKYMLIINKWEINFANTSNDTADTYKYIKSLQELVKEYIEESNRNLLVIMNPKEGWSQWLERKNYFIPTTLTRNCCSTYKEGQINKFYDKTKNITHFLGMRKFESVKRQNYDYIMDYDKCVEVFKAANFPKTWTKVCPIVEWRDEHVWLYMLRRGLQFNRMYKLGFQRVGCLLCPFQSNYNDLLIQKYYPNRWKWWMDVLDKNYINTHVAKRLHWTKEEYKAGKWKTGISKVQELISLKFTNERCSELSSILDISTTMAKKYWNRECDCGKKCNPTEIAMFYKLCGRFEGVEDNRKPKCKKCTCEEMNITGKEYQKMYFEFREQGCNLF